MRMLVFALLSAARSSLKSRRELALENLALRQQLAVLRRHAQRPKLRRADRAFLVVLARVWPD
jgi:putative transposase